MHRLKELAEKYGGRVVGDPDIAIQGIRPFELARMGDITLASRTSFASRLDETQASAVIVGREIENPSRPLLVAENPKLLFAHIVALFHSQPFQPQGVSLLSQVGQGCRIADRVTIEPFVRIGNDVVIEEEVTVCSGTAVGDGCRIGAGSTLHPNVTLYSGVTLGRRVILHGGTVIGADGFGYVFDGQRQVKIPQTGTVILEDDVEIGANSCVDRATFGATVIEKHVKLDNHVHVGHNCRIGENTVVVGCVGISGSVEIGRRCVLAGQAGVIDHIRIGDDVTVMVKTAVTKDIPDGMIVSGQPSRDHREEMRRQALLRRLPEIYQEWKEIKAQLRKLAGAASQD